MPRHYFTLILATISSILVSCSDPTPTASDAEQALNDELKKVTLKARFFLPSQNADGKISFVFPLPKDDPLCVKSQDTFCTRIENTDATYEHLERTLNSLESAGYLSYTKELTDYTPFGLKDLDGRAVSLKMAAYSIDLSAYGKNSLMPEFANDSFGPAKIYIGTPEIDKLISLSDKPDKTDSGKKVWRCTYTVKLSGIPKGLDLNYFDRDEIARAWSEVGIKPDSANEGTVFFDGAIWQASLSWDL